MIKSKTPQRAILGALHTILKASAALSLFSFAAFPALAASNALMFSGGGETMIVPIDTLTAVERSVRDDGLNELYFQLSETDTAAFTGLTTRLEGQTLTITFCDEILAEPMVMVPIDQGSVLITGGTDASTAALFEALEGRLPCPEGGGS